MSILIRANSYEKAAGKMLRNGKELTSYQIQKRKYLFLEGIIRFLQLYAQNEIGNVELDIEKISLYTNSILFENQELWTIKDIESVFNMLEKALYNNVPLYRFFKLTKYQMKLFEKEHYEKLLESYKADAEKYPCLKCVWYESQVTNLGQLSKCNVPEEAITNRWKTRSGYHRIDSKKALNCKYLTELDKTQEFIDKYITDNNKIHIPYSKEELIEQLNKNAERLQTKIDTLDNSMIPPIIPEEDHVELDYMSKYKDKQDCIFDDLGRAFRSEMTQDEIVENHQKTIFLEGMINFIEIYTQIEIGSNYYADISAIAKYVDSSNTDIFTFQSVDEVYKYLENLVIDEKIDISKFYKLRYE